MTTPITVRIPANELDGCVNTDHAVMRAFMKCKDAGMPLKGALKYKGVESGVLEMVDEGNCLVYKWFPEK